MKRSEINRLIRESKSFFSSMQFRLPTWATWSPRQWKGARSRTREIVQSMLGWDLTDFGSNDFGSRGLILFTIRNGVAGRSAKTYAEKIMIVRENQETPMHFHWSKMEDIINRGGGNLVLELCGSTKSEQFSAKPVTVRIDGVTREVKAGGKVILTPGESICLTPGLYHRFYGEKGKGTVLVGEVSMVNDDTSDNRFCEPVGRFPAIDEDEAPLHLLATDYKRYVS
jgi:D-lyxose ketol-isomerase